VGKATARAVVRHEYSDAMRVNVRSVIAYRAEQGDEWRGPWRGSMRQAQADARERNRQSPGVPIDKHVSGAPLGF
jgi:hypothetical protein